MGINHNKMESVAKEVDEKLKKFTDDLMQDIGATIDDAAIKYIASNYDKLVTVDGVYDYSKYEVELPAQYPRDKITEFVKGEKLVYVPVIYGNFNYFHTFTNYGRFLSFNNHNNHNGAIIGKLNYWIPPMLIDLFIQWLNEGVHELNDVFMHGIASIYHDKYQLVKINKFIIPTIKTLAEHSSEHADEFREKIRGLAVIDAAVQRYQKRPITRALVVETFEAAEKERNELTAARAALAKEREDFEVKKERLRMAAQNLAIQQTELDAKIKIISSVKYESI